MSDNTSDYEEHSDVEISEESHAKLLENVLNLDDKQHIKKPTRTEPSTEISEFHLVNSLTGNQGAIELSELTHALTSNRKLSEIGKQVRSFQKKVKTLEKPLEKPQEERLKRTVGYQKVKKEFSKWDPVVFHNRAATNLSFPLVKDINLDTAKNFTNRFRLKSDLQKELEKLEPKVEIYNVEEENKFPLTMAEVIERRKEAAKLRAIESYRAAKAKRESKIKSKKYHRIQRRERLKKQLKEFEELQKTNPEEALKKLEEIERARAEERLTLRHKSTGKWARNKQIRAKYDKESRQALAQQLQVSRELTQKIKVNERSDSEEDDSKGEKNEVTTKDSDNNPWLNDKIKASKDVADFISGYRKYWEEQNKKLQDTEDFGEVVGKSKYGNVESDTEKSKIVDHELLLNRSNEENGKMESHEGSAEISNTVEGKQHSTDKVKNENNKKNELSNNNRLHKTNKNEINITNKRKREATSKILGSLKNQKKIRNKNKLNASANKSLSTAEWEVSTLGTDILIDNISYIVQDKLKKNLEERAKRLRKQFGLEGNKTNKKKRQKDKAKQNYKVDLSLPSQLNHPIIDEPMSENRPRKSQQEGNLSEIISNKEDSTINEMNMLDNILSSSATEDFKDDDKNVDPNKFMKTKPVNLETGIPELLGYDDNLEDENQRNAIAEAFKDDEIVSDFRKKKNAEIEKDTPKDIDLTLPGWGSWGGTGIKVSKRKRKRFMIKFPKRIPRKDKNKGNLILKENNKSIKPHLVSELPFPFKKVKDFEASIRAPIGNTFIPETAFRRNIKPAVMTKMGSIIEPINEDTLLKKKKN